MQELGAGSTLDWGTSESWRQIKYIVGDLDLNYYMMDTKEYINSGLVKKDVPNLEEVVAIEGVAHFMQLERPDEITAHILAFIQKHWSLYLCKSQLA